MFWGLIQLGAGGASSSRPGKLALGAAQMPAAVLRDEPSLLQLSSLLPSLTEPRVPTLPPPTTVLRTGDRDVFILGPVAQGGEGGEGEGEERREKNGKGRPPLPPTPSAEGGHSVHRHGPRVLSDTHGRWAPCWALNTVEETGGVCAQGSSQPTWGERSQAICQDGMLSNRGTETGLGSPPRHPSCQSQAPSGVSPRLQPPRPRKEPEETLSAYRPNGEQRAVRDRASGRESLSRVRERRRGVPRR